MSDAELSDEALAIVEVVAGAIREELGEEVDAYPGFRSPEAADPLNRAFRAVVRSLLAPDLAPGESLSAAVSLALRRVAERRLAVDGCDVRRVRLLIAEEPGGPDDWLAFLILSSPAQVKHAFRRDDPDRA